MDGPRRIPVEDVIDLHAFRPAEVPALVEDYIDEAVRAGFRFVRIIHGKGGGVVRERVRRALARNPHVEGFGEAPAEAGGWGATLVTLRTGKPTSGG